MTSDLLENEYVSWTAFYEAPDIECDCCAYDDRCPCQYARDLAREKATMDALYFGMRTMVNAVGGEGVEYWFEILQDLHGRPDPAPPVYVKKGIDPLLRQKIMERDGYRCQACDDWHNLSLDHKDPEVFGGLATEENLHVLCRRCNSQKGVKTWEEYIESLGGTSV